MSEMVELVAKAILDRDFMGESSIGSMEAEALARAAIAAIEASGYRIVIEDDLKRAGLAVTESGDIFNMPLAGIAR